MTVFRYTLMRLMRNKINLLMVLICPPLFIGMIFGLGNFGPTEITVGLVDLDNTPLTQILAETLSRTSPVVMLEEEGIRSALAGGKADYILVIDSGFTQDIIAGKDPGIRGYSIQEANLASRAKLQVEGFVGAVKGIAANSQGSEDFYRGLAAYEAGSFAVKTRSFATEARSVDGAMGGIGMLAMNMLLLSSFTTVNLIKDRENLVMAVFALLCVAMGMALASMARTTQQAGTASSLIITPMCMLSGLFWPRAIMPDILQTIGKFLPATWAVEAAQKVMMGNPLTDVGMELAILLGYILVFFLLGTWRRVEVAN
jgi:ABC-2 type transport system permease protein